MNEKLLKLFEIIEKDNSIFELLKQCPYEILREFQVREYKSNEFTLEQGEIHNKFYIIISGYLDIYVESENGKKYLLCTYEKGAFVGELEIFNQVQYISRVESKGDVIMLELDREYFMKWVKLDQNFNQYLIRNLCSNSYRMCAEMGQNTLYTLKQRICQHLIKDVKMNGKSNIRVSSEILSKKMAVTQRSINRVLKYLKEKNIIEINNGNVFIKNYNELLNEQYEK